MEESTDKTQEENQESNPNPLVKRVRKFLFKNLRVGVIDGRVFVGKFHCLDKQENIILYDAVEYRPITKKASSSTLSTSSDRMEQRNLGLILISAKVRTSCHVECSLEEQTSLLSLDAA